MIATTIFAVGPSVTKLPSAPASARRPPAIHAAKNHIGLGRFFATPPGVKKMPTPMTDETTSIVASLSVRTRGNSWDDTGRTVGQIEAVFRTYLGERHVE